MNYLNLADRKGFDMNKFKHARRAPKSQPAKFRRWLLPGLLALAGLVVIAVIVVQVQARQAAASYTPEVTGRPSASINHTAFDYGNVKNNTPVKTQFQVKNVGDQELVILGEPRVEVVEGCCPPRAAISSTALKPGEESTVSMQFMMHEGMDGPHEFRVHVLTNDPVQGEQQVVVRSNWIP